MKTSIDSVRVTEFDEELNRDCTRTIRVRDGEGRLMTDLVIQIFSRNPRDRVSYDKTLEEEVFHDYGEQISRGLAITVALHDDEVTKEFFDAVYGIKRDAPNPYMTFARSQVSASTDAISENESPSEETGELQKRMANIMSKSDGYTLVEQTLRARRRIFKFNKRYREQVS